MIFTAHLIACWTESGFFLVFFFFGGLVDAVERISLEREGKQDAGASKLRQQQIRSTWTKIFVS